MAHAAAAAAAAATAEVASMENVKRALLSQDSGAREDDAGPLKKNLFTSLFGGKRGPDPSRPHADDAYDSRAAIRISCEEGVDEEEMRKEYSRGRSNVSG